MGKLIVLEGVDASGKATQAARLTENLRARGARVRQISFPNYESDSSALVRMYLGGAFGSAAGDVNAYAASAFYAVDRFASWRTDWGAFLDEADSVLVADRYVSSNMVHQAAKFNDPAEKAAFLQWVDDFEYEKLGLPRPAAVLFLDMPPAFARELMRERANKITGDAQKDIHERDAAHLTRAYENACAVAEQCGWHTVHCVQGGAVRTIDEIQNEIFEIVNSIK